MTDVFNRELHVGDYVISMDQKYPQLLVGRVASFTKCRATIRFTGGSGVRRKTWKQTKMGCQLYKYAESDGTPCYPKAVEKKQDDEFIKDDPQQSFVWDEHSCPGDEDTILSLLMDEESSGNENEGVF